MKYQTIFKYRSVWMAFAILWIALSHSWITIPPLFSKIKQLGYGGVDIFLFASGLGCCFSLSRNPDLSDFFRKRAKKSLPMYYIFLIFFFAYEFLTSNITPKQILGNILCVGYLAGVDKQFNWYMSGMWVCYVLAPILVAILGKSSRVCQTGILTFLILLGVSFAWINNGQLILFSRLPIFFMGICFAKRSKMQDAMKKREVALWLLTMAVDFVLLQWCFNYYSDYLWSYGLYWYPFILITPGLCISISLFAEALSKTNAKRIITLLSKLGTHTFPIYLAHDFLFEYLIPDMIRDQIIPNSNLIWAIAFLAVIPAVLLLVGLERMFFRSMDFIRKTRAQSPV